MDYTDYLHLNELKLFKNLREHLPNKLNKTTNLLTVKDGVFYGWDPADNCVLTLNIKAARSRDGDNVIYQSLLPILPVIFKPEHILVNDNGSLLVIFGQSGVLVMELPSRFPPYGAFDHNKELIYCRCYSLDERLFLSNDSIQVRQVRFHPGSVKNNHIVVLSSDNQLRLYTIDNSNITNLTVLPIGDKPKGLFPGTKTTYLDIYGEIGIDFDFGQPELQQNQTNLLIKQSIIKQQNNEDIFKQLQWPIYVLRGDCNIYLIHLQLDSRLKSTVKGPIWTNFDNQQNDCCSIICLNTNPEVVCIANLNGLIYHAIIVPKIGQELELNECDRELLCFETIELELGLSTNDNDIDKDRYNYPIFFHKDESNRCRYFTTHSTGIHSVTISCLKDLQTYLTTPDKEQQQQQQQEKLDDIFLQESKIEYLLCTQTTNIKTNNNPIYGFCLYYQPISLITLLNDGNLISLQLLTTIILPKIEDLSICDQNSDTNRKSPLKNKETFEQRIEKILKPPSKQPILKLNHGEHSQKECYELLQRTSQIFRDYYFENLCKSNDELHRHCRQLKMRTDFQLNELERMNNEKQQLQQNAENLSEKYEDIKDKQDLLMKRCEKLLILITQKKLEPSDAELDYLNELKRYQNQLTNYKMAIDKLKLKIKYQQLQIDNWKSQDERQKNLTKNLTEQHETTIRNNLKEMSEKITSMIKEVNEFKERLNLK